MPMSLAWCGLNTTAGTLAKTPSFSYYTSQGRHCYHLEDTLPFFDGAVVSQVDGVSHRDYCMHHQLQDPRQRVLGDTGWSRIKPDNTTSIVTQSTTPTLEVRWPVFRSSGHPWCRPRATEQRCNTLDNIATSTNRQCTQAGKPC
jgi:hypothetical protein